MNAFQGLRRAAAVGLGIALCLSDSAGREAFAHPHGTEAVASTPAADGTVLGEGQWTFRTRLGQFVASADGPALGTATHGGVATAPDGRVFVTLAEGPAGLLAFPTDGGVGAPLGPELAGGHSLLARAEGGTTYLYLTQLGRDRAVKATLEGEVVWEITAEEVKSAVEQTGLYATPRPPRGVRPFKPTAVAVAADGRIYVADGYGESVIHAFSPEREHVGVIGYRGVEPGEFRTCHGIAIDARGGEERLLVCDRENRRLQLFDLDGRFLAVVAEDLDRPCAVAIRGDYAAVAELRGRVTILDADHAVVARLGRNPDESQRANFGVPVETWRAGVFTAPHGLCFDGDDLLVTDWNAAGRLTRLERLR